MHTNKLTTASGKPVCRYALGGAARTVQPESLPLKYGDILSNLDHQDADAAPFCFYYNPHRYPAFLSGVAESFIGDESNYDRKDVFLASGGTELSPTALDQRLNDALVHSGGEYLDAFMLEYICPYELLLEGDNQQQQLGEELMGAIEHVHKMKKDGKVRHVMASTHSHVVGKALALATLSDDGMTPAFDGLMLRYSMSHKNAAESLSLPAALERNIPVLAFTTTRWNRHQTANPPTTTSGDTQPPSSADCIKFALDHPAVEVVLHSARDEEELEESLLPILSASSNGQYSTWLSKKERDCWRTYGSDEKLWNENDSFDEYPEESF